MNQEFALVTGGSKGIGLAIAKDLVKTHNLALIYRDDTTSAENAKSLLRQINPLASISVYQCDIANFALIETVYKKIKDDFAKSPEILINNAGRSSSCLFVFQRFEICEELININYLGPVKLTKLVSTDMMRKKYGRIINITTNSIGMAVQGHSAYASSKAALEKTGLILGGELSKYNITVNSIRPGLAKTEMTDDWLASLDSVAYKNVMGPAGKLIEVDSIASTVRFLINSAQINSSIISVDGGSSIFRNV